MTTYEPCTWDDMKEGDRVRATHANGDRVTGVIDEDGCIRTTTPGIVGWYLLRTPGWTVEREQKLPLILEPGDYYRRAGDLLTVRADGKYMFFGMTAYVSQYNMEAFAPYHRAVKGEQVGS